MAWKDFPVLRTQPAEQVAVFTPTLAGSTPWETRGVMVGVDATVVLKPTDSATVSIGLAGKVLYPLAVTHIFTTGTGSVGVWIFR